MTRIIFIGATGTDIGKTYVTCMLLRQLQQQGHKVRAIKPVMSGFDPQAIEQSDSGQLLLAMNQPTTLDNVRKISPWRFKDPLPPHLAAAQAGKPLKLDEIISFCQNQLEDDLDFLLIEGAGGIMTPLNEQQTLLDLMIALDGSCLLVTASSLGTLSHTLTALACIKQTALKVDGLIISESIESYTDFDGVMTDFANIFPAVALKFIRRDQTSEEFFSLVL
ncbi:MAG: dethiobiotin synthase [Emcibacter sp.]|nr:dethiobiotin synthase [Emcibacter sp.]